MKSMIKKAIRSLVEWAMRAEVDAALYEAGKKEHEHMLRYGSEQARLRRQHQDWKDECRLTNEHRERCEKIWKDQNALMSSIVKVMEKVAKRDERMGEE